ncbi:hypothetical protein QW131_10265 [Roseibium salinum]|nr:hypothetical protein [Roseibium salinum]
MRRLVRPPSRSPRARAAAPSRAGFSTVILNVQEIQPEHTQPFEEVKAGIVQDLSKEQAEREILDLLDEVEDARAGGALLDEIGERFSLPVEAPEAFDSSGKSISGGEADLPDAEGLIEGGHLTAISASKTISCSSVSGATFGTTSLK